jgi:replicative DNA helicase
MRTSNKGGGRNPCARDIVATEQALLGAVLIDAAVLDCVKDVVQPHHFIEPVHQRIFATMLELRRNPAQHESSASIDPDTEYFLRLDWFSKISTALADLHVPARLSVLSHDDDRGYAATLIVEATTFLNSRKYAEVIREAALDRSAAASEILEAA